MLWRRTLLFPLLVVACGDDDHFTIVDGGVIDAGPTVAVHTNAPASSLAAPGPTNATFAMAQKADGSWAPLEPAATGLYAVPLRGDGTRETGRWTVAFVCADDKSSYVQIYDRAATVTDLVIDLPAPCALPDGEVGDLVGHFAHAPPATSWFDFGYFADERGSVLPLTGDGADYELLNLVNGKWDLMFGFRDDSSGPLTKLFIMRDETLAGNTVLDADLGAVGIVPGSKALTITGLTADEESNAPVVYSLTGGPHGVDMGPASALGPNLTYATVPLEQQRPSDRYRLAFRASAPDRSASRGANAMFHDALDIALDLPPALPAPVVTSLGAAPYLRLSMKTVGRANAATYELVAITQTTDNTGRYWTYSTDAAAAEGAEVAFDMPDFSAVPGWNNGWSVEANRLTVTATVHERSAPLGDGALQRFASHETPFAP
ncbi:MAG: hypothetical protein U0270_42090 [Labilithrix sp.]